jgi:hypothetical protein
MTKYKIDQFFPFVVFLFGLFYGATAFGAGKITINEYCEKHPKSNMCSEEVKKKAKETREENTWSGYESAADCDRCDYRQDLSMKSQDGKIHLQVRCTHSHAPDGSSKTVPTYEFGTAIVDCTAKQVIFSNERKFNTYYGVRLQQHSGHQITPAQAIFKPSFSHFCPEKQVETLGDGRCDNKAFIVSVERMRSYSNGVVKFKENNDYDYVNVILDTTKVKEFSWFRNLPAELIDAEGNVRKCKFVEDGHDAHSRRVIKYLFTLPQGNFLNRLAIGDCFSFDLSKAEKKTSSSK